VAGHMEWNNFFADVFLKPFNNRNPVLHKKTPEYDDYIC
jgi:hypothetical protein